ncbi:Nin one binding Zn-ribbon like-domain-containing protein [Auriculariales sp. MPI-PUGE-AT-0066]|nr:Nin one binding Zn-ribbon like-domain-containing protein [Auriculariales sp. MPI-PUGE-AT-0066]
MPSHPNCVDLVLDAGPLLSQTPLRGVATNYYTVPQVISELRDQKAREHLERLALVAGSTSRPASQTLQRCSRVCILLIACSKKSGDYSVLSQPDLAVLALTLTLHEQAAKLAEKANQPAIQPELKRARSAAENTPVSTSNEPKSFAAIAAAAANVPQPAQPLVVQLDALKLDNQISNDAESGPEVEIQEVSEDESEEDEEDDGEGEWITPDNVSRHKARGLELIPDDPNAEQQTVAVGCMTADYAMQNVLLHLGLNLLDIEGRRISTVKTWVLRCHACFKLCKDSSKKFCPSCGNATLLRTSITTHAPKEAGGAPVVQVHLKKNFQYRLRGSQYSIPAPKAGSAKRGPGAGGNTLILREDQQEWQRAVRKEKIRQEKDERKMLRSLESGGGTGFNDPDWIPDILVGARTAQGGLPAIGHGRRNPNERRRKR